MNKCKKIIIDFKTLKIKIKKEFKKRKKKEKRKKKKKENNSKELPKPNVEAEVYNNSKQCD